MLKNQSVATIAAPEFINIEPYNPLISQCEIKVLYLGENRNGSFITEEVAKDMANSLPGTPIVAAYIENKDDFGTHGHVVTIEDDEVKFSCKTQPYGFVAPDAKVWFQEFIDKDDFGNDVYRKYLMTTGYLWTGQFPELQKVLDEGMPQSMELDEKSLDGHWALNHNSGVEFFIINDATFSKLCILGSDVEPCFEGASVTEKHVSKNFAKESEFMNMWFAMMKDMLNYKGGSDMLEDEKEVVTKFDEAAAGGDSTSDSDAAETNAEDTPSVEEQPAAEETPVVTATPAATVSDPENIDETGTEEEIHNDMVEKGLVSDAAHRQDFTKKEDEKAAEDEKTAPKDEKPADEKDPKSEEEQAKEDEKKKTDHACAEDDEKKAKTDHSLEEELASVKAEFEAAQAELQELRDFKLGIENQQKDALIAKYFMLSDEDKADIISNKENYSLDEIDAKLALLYVKKNVDFSTVSGETEAEETQSENPVTTFSLDSAVDMTGVPDIVKALRAAK